MKSLYLFLFLSLSLLSTNNNDIYANDSSFTSVVEMAAGTTTALLTTMLIVCACKIHAHKAKDRTDEERQEKKMNADYCYPLSLVVLSALLFGGILVTGIGATQLNR